MKILFFASLRERLNTAEEDWNDLQNICTVADVKLALVKRGEPWADALSNPKLIVSINQEISNLDAEITANDELAFYPPVTGG